MAVRGTQLIESMKLIESKGETQMPEIDLFAGDAGKGVAE
jgi:hypothetical protein